MLNNELLTKDAVIEEIWNVFNEHVNSGIRFDECETAAINKAFGILQKAIEEKPASYDLEKVVEELEWVSEIEFHFDGSKPKQTVNYVDAVKVIRDGGLKDDEFSHLNERKE